MFDVEGANQVGIPCYAVSFGFGDVGKMLAAGAVDVCDDMKDLQSIIEKHCS